MLCVCYSLLLITVLFIKTEILTGDWSIYWVFIVCKLGIGLRTTEGILKEIKHFHNKFSVWGRWHTGRWVGHVLFSKCGKENKYIALRSMIELSKYTKSPTYAVINKDWFYLFLQRCKSTNCSWK